MALRIYGPNQTAGVLITTTGKGNITNDGLQAYAQAVVAYDGSGNPAPAGSASDPEFVVQQLSTLTVKGYKQIAAASTTTAFSLATAGVATTLGAGIPSGATVAIISPEAQGLRWRDDGTAPTTAIGMRVLTDNELAYNGPLAAWQGINLTAGTICNITFYG